MVASSVTFDATRYFRSPPIAMSCVRPIPVAVYSDTFLVTAYGAASSRRGASRSSSPLISPNCDTNPDCDWRNIGQLTRWA